MSSSEAGIPMGVASPDGRWIRVNQALGELLGATARRSCSALSPRGSPTPTTGRSEREALRLLLAGECTSYTTENRCLRRTR